MDKGGKNPMTLSITLVIYLGFLIECLWLWEAAYEKRSKSKGSLIKSPGVSTPTMAVGIVLAVGALLIGLSEIVGENAVTLAIDNFLSYLLMGIAMFFILVAGAVGGWLVPRVNEFNIVSVLAIVALNTLTQNTIENPWWVGILMGVPLVLSLVLALQKSAPSIGSKVILYLLYLGALILLTLQSSLMEMFQQSEFSIIEAFVFGTMLAFLSLHTLLGLRFVLITSSFILPANRRYAEPMMRNLFKDEQLPPFPFFLTLVVILSAVLLNHWLGLFPTEAFAVVLVILSTQLLFRSRTETEVV